MTADRTKATDTLKVLNRFLALGQTTTSGAVRTQARRLNVWMSGLVRRRKLLNDPLWAQSSRHAPILATNRATVVCVHTRPARGVGTWRV